MGEQSFGVLRGQRLEAQRLDLVGTERQAAGQDRPHHQRRVAELLHEGDEWLDRVRIRVLDLLHRVEHEEDGHRQLGVDLLEDDGEVGDQLAATIDGERRMGDAPTLVSPRVRGASRVRLPAGAPLLVQLVYLRRDRRNLRPQLSRDG